MFTTGIFARQSQQLLIEEEATQRKNTKRFANQSLRIRTKSPINPCESQTGYLTINLTTPSKARQAYGIGSIY
jgi:hypothetical protein